jgi:membrane-bound serine protease (ClpP class)
MPAISVDPNIVYLILLLGLWTGVTAAYVPGTGVVELLSVVVTGAAVVSLAAMPTNWLAVLLVVVGVAGFLVMPLIARRLALLAVGGLVLQAIGSLFLFNGPPVSVALLAATLILSLVYHQFVLLPVLNSHHRLPALEESDQLAGARGRLLTDTNPLGSVRAAGETWQARSPEPLEAGTEVVVVSRDGLILNVESIKRKREEMSAGVETEPEELGS